MAASNFPILRGLDAQQSRTQDNVSQVLTPVAKALQNTPIMGAPPPSWILPSLLNGYASFGLGTAAPAFHRDALGYVHLKGLLQISVLSEDLIQGTNHVPRLTNLTLLCFVDRRCRAHWSDLQIS